MEISKSIIQREGVKSSLVTAAIVTVLVLITGSAGAVDVSLSGDDSVTEGNTAEFSLTVDIESDDQYIPIKKTEIYLDGGNTVEVTVYPNGTISDNSSVVDVNSVERFSSSGYGYGYGYGYDQSDSRTDFGYGYGYGYSSGQSDSLKFDIDVETGSLSTGSHSVKAAVRAENSDTSTVQYYNQTKSFDVNPEDTDDSDDDDTSTEEEPLDGLNETENNQTENTSELDENVSEQIGEDEEIQQDTEQSQDQGAGQDETDGTGGTDTGSAGNEEEEQENQPSGPTGLFSGSGSLGAIADFVGGIIESLVNLLPF